MSSQTWTLAGCQPWIRALCIRAQRVPCWPRGRGGAVQSGNPPRRGEVVLTMLDPCRARVTQA